MIEVEMDIFSGMPNPVWMLTRAEEQQLVERVQADPGQVSPVATDDEQFSLGYRGLIVRQVKPDGSPIEGVAAGDAALPLQFRIGSRPVAGESAADWLLTTSEPSRKHSRVTDDLREVAAAGVALVQPMTATPNPVSFAPPGESEASEFARFPVIEGEGAHIPNEPSSGVSAVAGGTWWACGSNYFSANADLFNRPEYVTQNNCYCFASNHLANVRYALPGRRGGHPATSITCSGVTAGLYADGWKDGCQTNGLTIVLVIWPGYDYHFYRLVTGGPYWWWGHKPGGTPAKYTDDCGHSIYQYNDQGYAPNNCCRGNYTDFCGYFY